MRTQVFDINGNMITFERWNTKSEKRALANQIKLLSNELYAHCIDGLAHEIKVVEDSDSRNERVVMQKYV